MSSVKTEGGEIVYPDMPKITLKAARVNAGLTQSEAAKKLGISQRQLLTWEKHPDIVKTRYLPKIAEVYRYPQDLIIFA